MTDKLVSVPDAKQLVEACLKALDVPEPVTPEMSEAEVMAAKCRVVERLMRAVQHS